ncbi:MAG TPA: peptide chain release factor N(5)-glutamine methyltransferase [Candidatus Saccharibacteria bacterium]|nr:peptide chain release factor N(5)-glutamine methyltransferase [Candidatus Saccharibacteria bacterium]
MSSTHVTISEKLRETEQLFSKAGIPSPRLDAEVLLAYALDVDRTYLHAHATDTLQGSTLQKFEKLVERRLRREPVAYITGRKEFYGREFIVTPDVLIPRPETEELVELILRSQVSGLRSSVLDVGCGSGCIGITLKLEQPEMNVTLSDISPEALGVAKRNAEKLGATVGLIESDLLSQSLPSEISFDIIVANLPYVDKDWETSPETEHEPALSLYADNHGLELIDRLIKQSSRVLDKHGWLFLEADPEQHDSITTTTSRHGLQPVEIQGYAMSFVRQA